MAFMTPEEELALLQSAPPVTTKRSEAKLAAQIFEDHAALAAEVVVDVMINSTNEKTKLQAAKYVTERVLGRVGEAKPETEGNPWDGLFGSITREPTAEERQAGTRVSRI